MTGLNRTQLTLSQKVQCAAQALGRQAHGVITALSLELGISRPTVYEAAATAEEVLREHFERARDAVVYLEVDEAQLRRAVIALRSVGPNSHRVIEELLPVLYPGHRLSYGKIWQWVAEAERAAEQFNRQVSLSAIEAGALDELFSQGSPVLAGIDLDSGYLFHLAKCEDRSGASWARLLGQARDQGLALRLVVKDAALGIAAGVREVFPQAQQRDDCFHALYEIGKVHQRLERRAYSAIEHEEEVRKRLSTIRAQQVKPRRQLKQKLAWAQRQSDPIIARYDAFDTAAAQVRQALSWINLDTGQIRTGELVRTELCQAAEAMRQIDDDGCRKVAQYLINRAPGLAHYADDLHAQLTELAEHYEEESVCLAAIMVQLCQDLAPSQPSASYRETARHLLGVYHQPQGRLGERAEELINQVQQLWQKRHRASSAIEGFNARLRPYLYVHKHVSPGFLHLFQAYHNLRTRRWGRHRGTSAYQCLIGQNVDDWLTCLGFPPSASHPGLTSAH